MATSGVVCIRFIIQNTFSPRFLPIICQHVNSKSKEIRRYICEILDQLLHTWPTHTLEKHVAILQEAIKKGADYILCYKTHPDPLSQVLLMRIQMPEHLPEKPTGDLLNTLKSRLTVF